MEFHPARRKGTFGLIGLTGLSGSGKTHSALLLARGLVGPQGRIAAIDSENRRMSLFEGLTPFDVADIAPPFTPELYQEAIEAAVAAKYNALIIDSGSHEWEGAGGILEIAAAGRTRAGKPLEGLAKWMAPKTRHKRFVNAMLIAPLHVILCLRGKDRFVQTRDPKTGREIIVNAGIEPIQEGRVLYEMTISLIMDQETQCPRIRKCPHELRHLFPDDKRISEAAGAELGKWFATGEAIADTGPDIQQTARTQASFGTDTFRAWYKDTTKPQRAALQPIMDALKAAAEQADRAAEQDIPDDPFADEAPQQDAPPPADTANQAAGLADGWPGPDVPPSERGPEDLMSSG